MRAAKKFSECSRCSAWIAVFAVWCLDCGAWIAVFAVWCLDCGAWIAVLTELSAFAFGTCRLYHK